MFLSLEIPVTLNPQEKDIYCNAALQTYDQLLERLRTERDTIIEDGGDKNMACAGTLAAYHQLLDGLEIERTLIHLSSIKLMDDVSSVQTK